MDSERLSEHRLRELTGHALRARWLIVETVYHAGAGHLGGPLSATDLLIALYFDVMHIDPAQPKDPDRDRFILSKGHCAVGLYTVMALRGYFPIEELSTFDAIDSRLQAHPEMNFLPGLDMSTGSLGQGISTGIGMALAARLRGGNYHTWVMIGDGESQEGQNWEAAFLAERYGLDNLTVILDLNRLQQFGFSTEAGYGSPARRPPVENAAAQWRGFGWAVLEIDGHDFGQIIDACAEAKTIKGRPTIIIARTV
jgi:transketolase